MGFMTEKRACGNSHSGPRRWASGPDLTAAYQSWRACPVVPREQLYSASSAQCTPGHTAPAQGLCSAFPLQGCWEAVVMERHLVVLDSWNSLDFSTEQVLVQMCAVLGVVELDLASSQGAVKTSIMSSTTTSTHWVLKPCLEF